MDHNGYKSRSVVVLDMVGWLEAPVLMSAVVVVVDISNLETGMSENLGIEHLPGVDKIEGIVVLSH